MPDLDDVLERLVNDAGFRRELEEDPDRALATYALTPEERGVLDATVSASRGAAGSGAVEGRQSKSAMVGMVSEIAGVVGRGEDAGIIIICQPGEDVGFNPQPDPPIAERGIR
jgi:hypothetical protein